MTDVFVVPSQRGADSWHPDLKEEIFRAVRSVLLCLTELTDSSLEPSDGGNDGSQLRLLQQEVSGPFQLHVPNAFLI